MDIVDRVSTAANLNDSTLRLANLAESQRCRATSEDLPQHHRDKVEGGDPVYSKARQGEQRESHAGVSCGRYWSRRLCGQRAARPEKLQEARYQSGQGHEEMQFCAASSTGQGGRGLPKVYSVGLPDFTTRSRRHADSAPATSIGAAQFHPQPVGSTGLDTENTAIDSPHKSLGQIGLL